MARFVRAISFWGQTRPPSVPQRQPVLPRLRPRDQAAPRAVDPDRLTAAVRPFDQLRHMAQCGQAGDDVGSLKTGRFYVSNADHLAAPTKLMTPMCLSAHKGPLDAEAILRKAAASRTP